MRGRRPEIKRFHVLLHLPPPSSRAWSWRSWWSTTRRTMRTSHECWTYAWSCRCEEVWVGGVLLTGPCAHRTGAGHMPGAAGVRKCGVMRVDAGLGKCGMIRGVINVENAVSLTSPPFMLPPPLRHWTSSSMRRRSPSPWSWPLPPRHAATCSASTSGSWTTWPATMGLPSFWLCCASWTQRHRCVGGRMLQG